MNASPYRGIAPRTTAALRARRYLVQTLGRDAVDAMDRERIDYYRTLMRIARGEKPL